MSKLSRGQLQRLAALVVVTVTVAGTAGGGVDSPEDHNQDEGNDESAKESATVIGLLTLLLVIGARGVVLTVTTLTLASAEPDWVKSDEDEPDDNS